MQQVNDQQSSTDSKEEDMTQASGQITPAKIEQLVKEFKTHHCAMDFDRGFIDAVFIKKEEEWMVSSEFGADVCHCDFMSLENTACARNIFST